MDVDWAKKVIRKDVCLFDTKFGKWIRKKFGIEEVAKKESKIKEITSTEKIPVYVNARIYKSKNKFGDLTAQALTRTSKYGAYALTGLGALHAAHEIADGEDIFKTVGKTATEIGTTLVGTGYLGAIGYKHYGPLGSLVGIGAATILATNLTQQIFKKDYIKNP